MTTDEYLKTCTNVPPLPSGWKWRLTREIHQRENRQGEWHPWVDVLIEIIDKDTVLASRVMSRRAKWASEYPQVMDSELAKYFRATYNNLYAEEKVDFHKAVGH